MPTSKKIPLLGCLINSFTWDDALTSLIHWGAAKESRYVCICNVHSMVTAYQDPSFKEIINAADMATSDGMPLTWSLRMLGHPEQKRINGPDLMWKYCELAVPHGQSIFLYGGTDATLVLLQNMFKAAFPCLQIAGAYSPPFRTLTEVEKRQSANMINSSGAAVVFVGLGCPKQEQWMAAHRGVINAVMVGVGAAFDYHAGTVKRAPLWMQHNGLEWLYRLLSEPRRLWKRYLVTNTLFIVLMAKQLLSHKLNKR